MDMLVALITRYDQYATQGPKQCLCKFLNNSAFSEDCINVPFGVNLHWLLIMGQNYQRINQKA
jgi:hypothetical protein